MGLQKRKLQRELPVALCSSEHSLRSHVDHSLLPGATSMYQITVKSQFTRISVNVSDFLNKVSVLNAHFYLHIKPEICLIQ